MNKSEAFQHFGYTDTRKLDRYPNGAGLWPREKLHENLLKIPEFLEKEHAGEKKFRIVLDYDPEYPTVLFRFEGEPIEINI